MTATGSARDRDAGVTLIELIISIVIVSIITTTIVVAIPMILKTVPETTARIDDDRSLTALAVYLPEDVSSTPPGAFDVSPGAVPGCGSSSPGTSLLKATWTEAGSTFSANYRYVADGDGWVIRRVTCRGTTMLAAMDVTSRLQEEAACPPASPGKLVGVRLRTNGSSVSIGATFDVQLGCEMLEVSASSDNPAEVLGPPATAPPPVTAASTTTTVAATTTTTSTTVPSGPTTTDPTASTTSTSTTTTSTTTTTIAPCDAGAIVSVDPSPVNNGSKEDAANLNKDVVVTITSSGNCPSLGLLYDPVNPDGTGTFTPLWMSFAGSTSLSFRASGGDLWKDGEHTLRLKNGMNSTVTLDTATLKVT